MGCDIHAHTEIKIHGAWRHWGTPDIDRNYWLFGRMAGVRGDGPSIAPVRGIPDDVTFETRFACDDYGTDGHNHSWLSAKEMSLLGGDYDNHYRDEPGRYFEAQVGFIFGNGWDLEGAPKGVEDARLVFWFDN